MKDLIKSKTFIEFITVVILITLIIFFCNNRKDNCIKNGGKVVTDVYGLFDKCIYEGD